MIPSLISSMIFAIIVATFSAESSSAGSSSAESSAESSAGGSDASTMEEKAQTSKNKNDREAYGVAGIDECKLFGPCENGGTCEDLLPPKDYVCHCPEMFSGKNCEKRLTTIVTEHLPAIADHILLTKIKESRECCSEGCHNYRGELNSTVSGFPCESWDKVLSGPVGNRFESWKSKGLHLEGNYCRNPTAVYHSAWCFVKTSEKKWERCALPKCVAEDIHE